VVWVLFTAGDQVPWILLVELAGKLRLPPEHIAAIGLKAGAVGLVTLRVVVAVQPLLLVKVIVAVPKLTAVTSPVLDTVATAALLEPQGLFALGFALAVNWDVVFGHKVVEPVMVGLGATVTVT
jgi:hypothetical protein